MCDIQMKTVDQAYPWQQGEFIILWTVACIAWGDSCTNSVSFYLNIGVNTSVCKVLSAH